MSLTDSQGQSAFLKEIESPLEEVRVGALTRLGEVPSLAILRAVRRLAATDPSVEVRSRARKLLEAASRTYASQGVGVEEADERSVVRVRALLEDPDPAVRVQVIRSLAMNLDPGVPVLLASLLETERDPYVVSILLQGLAATGGAELADRLIPFLRHPDHRVRATTVESLEAMGDSGLLAHLLPLLEDPHHRVRASVARALQAQEREAVLATVDAMLGGADEMSVRAAAYVLRFFDDGTALSRLRRALASPSPGVQQMAGASLLFLARKGSKSAAQIIARIEGLAAVTDAAPVTLITSPVADSLESRLDSADYEERVAAVLEAVRTGREELLPRLRGMVATETSSRVLATLAAGLGCLGGPEEVIALQRLLTYHEPRVRANAVESIGKLRPGQVADLLSGALTDENNRVRANAIVALHGSPGVDALGPLTHMATHADSRFVRSAIWAAGAIATPATIDLLSRLAAAGTAHSQAARTTLRTLAPVVREAASASQPDGDVRSGIEEHEKPVVTSLTEAERQRLVFDLRHDSPAMRLQALGRIAESGDRGFLQPVRMLLSDDDPAVRRAARAGVRSLLLRVTDQEIDVRVLEAFEVELSAGSERAKRVLGHVVDITLKCGMGIIAAMLAGRLPIESDPFVRAQIISGLALVGERDIAGIVQAFVRDPDARVRANALDALDLLSEGRDMQAVVTCLSDPDPRVRSVAVAMAVALHGEPFLGQLKAMLVSESIAERAAGLYALSSVDIPERHSLLKEYFLAETQPKLYESCAEALAPDLVMRPDELESLAEKLPEGDKRHYLRVATYRLRDERDGEGTGRSVARAGMEAVSWILDMKKGGMLGGEQVRTALQQENDPLAIILLLESARELRMPDVLDLALPFTHSKDRRLRLAAAEAVGTLGGPEASEVLAVLVRDRDSEVSRRALESLQALDASAARSGIRALFGAGQLWSAQRGLELLEKIGGPEDLHLVLDLLARGGMPGLAEPITRLVLLWGGAGTLEMIAAMIPAARPGERPLILDVARKLGARLGRSAAELIALFPPPPALDPGAADRPPEGAGSQAARTRSRAIAVTAAAALLLALFPLRNLPDAPSSPDRSFASAAAHRLSPGMIGEPPRPPGPGAAGLPSHLLTPSHPASLESELARVAALLARRRITHAPLLHLIALESFHADYRTKVIEARNLATRGRFSESLRLLESCLASLDPRHLLGRQRILLALEATYRLSGRGLELERTRLTLREIRTTLSNICQEGVRSGAIPDDRLAPLLSRLDAYCRLQRPSQDPALWLLR